jgi:hypothetical protein
MMGRRAREVDMGQGLTVSQGSIDEAIIANREEGERLLSSHHSSETDSCTPAQPSHTSPFSNPKSRNRCFTGAEGS